MNVATSPDNERGTGHDRAHAEARNVTSCTELRDPGQPPAHRKQTPRSRLER